MPVHHTRMSSCFEVRFASLFRPGRAVSFPCDEAGYVDLDTLPEQARRNYLSACQRIGSEYSTPQVCVAEPIGPASALH